METNLRPLVPIFDKPLHQCPLRLQCMRLSLQRYAIKLQYKPGKELFLTDALSRLPSTLKMQVEAVQFGVNVFDYVSASERRLKYLLAATNEDPALVKLRDFAETTWPDNKQAVPEAVRPY